METNRFNKNRHGVHVDSLRTSRVIFGRHSAMPVAFVTVFVTAGSVKPAFTDGCRDVSFARLTYSSPCRKHRSACRYNWRELQQTCRLNDVIIHRLHAATYEMRLMPKGLRPPSRARTVATTPDEDPIAPHRSNESKSRPY